VLISSAFLSSATWRTDQLENPTAIQTPAPTPVPRQTEQQKQTGTQDQTNGIPGRARRGDRTDEGAGHPDISHHEPRLRHDRRVHAKRHEETGRANPGSQERDNGSGQDTEPVRPFLAVLGDILPKAAPAAPDEAGSAASQAAGPSSKLPQTVALPGLTANPLPDTQAANLPPVDGAVSTAPAKAGSPDQINERPDPSFAITREPIATAASASSGQTAAPVKTTESGEVAFAARIAERPGQPAALTLRGADAAIAASRFEAEASGGQPGGGAHADPRGTAPAHQDTSSVPSAVTASQQEPDNQPAANPPAPAPPATAAQQAVPASSGWRAAATAANPAAISAMPAAGPRGGATAQNAIPGLPAAASTSSAPQGARDANAEKPAESDAPQLMEPQGEERATESVRDISLRLTDKDQGSVQVRLSERAGELHVSVRTPDAGLTRGLRDGLSDLVGRLENSGYRAETWQPAGGNASNSHDQSHDSSSRGGQQQSGGGSGSGAGHQDNARDQQERGGQTPKWVSELESNLKRSDKAWQPSATR
jgi:hypothetical protein